MIPTPDQIRLLARYFDHTQITKLCFASMDEIRAATKSMHQPTRGLPMLIADLERLEVMDVEKKIENLAKEVSHGIEIGHAAWEALRAIQPQYNWRLCVMKESEFLVLKDFGRRSFARVKGHLADLGLSLGMSPDDPLIIEAKRRTGHV